MGKGGPLAFLNKKPWHPANFRNQEKIWEKEQEYMKEVEKREELKKQIEEQREEEGFQDFVAEATKQKCANKCCCVQLRRANASLIFRMSD